MANIPDELIKLERSAEAERAKLTGLDGDEHAAQWRQWASAAEAFQGAVTEYAARDDVTLSRHEVEQAAKKAVRHGEPETIE
ncbi:hypothetical protein STRCI_001243 [Streptomyces cinnabarinus]|uniref:Uncharacterized protein n=1 Tax=Streptomyces cinnabarinus TaxID=67287 RepID=A0ABY7K6J5_9ACTN|nr:hypothetical protein [Streptomyces cinnabarinus]WAZ20144.1 hypothetical protein STRCI_001243 [Streptomyces cinnabarinus]